MNGPSDDQLCTVCGQPVGFHPGGGRRPIYPQDCIALLMSLLREAVQVRDLMITEKGQLYDTIVAQHSYISNMDIQADQLAKMAEGYRNTAKAQSVRILDLEKRLRDRSAAGGE